MTTRQSKFHASILGWLLILALMGCASADAQNGATPAPQAISFLPQAAPEEVLTQFLDAWNVGDYEAMYDLISVRSREDAPLELFRNRYEQVRGVIGLTGITYTLGETTLQGTTAAIEYDVTLESGFDPIEDNGRIARLVDENGSWRLAWSTMDIIYGLAGDADIRVQSATARRGTIYDRDGEPIVQDGGRTVALYGSIQNMAGVDECLDLLASLFVDSRSRLRNVVLANRLPETIDYLGQIEGELYDQNVDALQATCGVQSESFGGTSVLRLYDRNGAAAHITGYVANIPPEELDTYRARGFSDTDLVGRMGVELRYNDALAGRPSRVLRIVEPGGATLRELAATEGTASQDVYLTIDRDLQRVTAQALTDAYDFAAPNWGGRSPGAGAVVLDVRTGRVLALASYPSFNPMWFNLENVAPNAGALISEVVSSRRQPLNNRVTQGGVGASYPGSTYKIITLAAALEEGLVAPTDIFNCELEWQGQQFGDTRNERTDWRMIDGFRAAGEITSMQALTTSCNPFFYQMGARLFNERGSDVQYQYARRMGIGALTGLGENSGMVEIPGILQAPTSVDVAINNAIGQGVQVTPIQMAIMTAGVANGGTLYRPYIVERVGDTTFEPQVIGDMELSDATLAAIREAMCNVTIYDYNIPDRDQDLQLGTAWRVFDPPPDWNIPTVTYTVCGKTGTAQTGFEEPNAWFVAFAPADDPQIAVVVFAERSREGSEVAAPITRRIMDYYFQTEIGNYPPWWSGEYDPLDIPEGTTGG
jgi:penicillin-binding protein 2